MHLLEVFSTCFYEAGGGIKPHSNEPPVHLLILGLDVQNIIFRQWLIRPILSLEDDGT